MLASGRANEDEAFLNDGTNIYFFDDDGNEFEFVEYLSADPEERNDYQL